MPSFAWRNIKNLICLVFFINECLVRVVPPYIWLFYKSDWRLFLHIRLREGTEEKEKASDGKISPYSPPHISPWMAEWNQLCAAPLNNCTKHRAKPWRFPPAIIVLRGGHFKWNCFGPSKPKEQNDHSMTTMKKSSHDPSCFAFIQNFRGWIWPNKDSMDLACSGVLQFVHPEERCSIQNDRFYLSCLHAPIQDPLMKVIGFLISRGSCF